MTTIVYHHEDKQVAVDSRITSGGLINTDKANKIISKGDLLFILTGLNCDSEKFINDYPNIETELNCSGFLVEDKKVYHVCVKDETLKKALIEYSDAEGSGYAFAIAAMDHGKSAKESIEYAMTRDNCTDGKVQVIDVETGNVI